MFNHIPENSIDLIYVDPPFFSNKNYELIWGDGYELRSFKDRWKGGIENYISWMEPKVRECHRVLKDTGSMYLHCDWHANAHLRILMAGIFGENNFQNEIIWHYQTGGASKVRYSRKHDNIYFFTKSDKWTFNSDAVKVMRTEKSLERAQNPKGARISSTDLYKNPDDVFDIPQMNPMAKERLGYPTQKPEALLEQIIKASSNPTDIVLDPMCGCGTAIAVANRLGRRYIGVDVSPTACKLMLRRVHKIDSSNILPYNEMDIIGLPRTAEEIKTMQPFEFQNWVLEKMMGRANPKKVSDMGIDGWIPLEANAPVQVKQSESVGRNVVDNFETAMRRINKTKGYIVAYSFTKGAYEEVARVANESSLVIELKTLDSLLKEE